MKGLLKQTNSTGIGAGFSFVSRDMTARPGGSFSCVQTIRTNVVYRSGISKSISERSGRKAEQRQLNSRVLHCFGQARSIMRQRRRKTQQETTVHKDMAREEFARQIAPDVGRHLRDALEQARQQQRERSGDE